MHSTTLKAKAHKGKADLRSSDEPNQEAKPSGGHNPMEPEESNAQRSAQERLARDVQKERALLRNILAFTLWTLVALVPTTILLLVEMALLWRVITLVLCVVFWALALGGMFRLTGLLDAGNRPVSLNPFHAGKGDTKDKTSSK